MDKKGLVLISSGIDSPVAAHLMQKRGIDLIAVHFSNEPLTDASPKEKTIKICKYLNIKKLYVVKHGFLVQGALMRECDASSRCVLCRRMMFKISEKIAEKEGCSFLVTGENLAQVASQTLENMYVEDSGIEMPILRPVLCNDKQETINIAKDIGTYELSIEASMCCNAVPKQPVTKASLKFIKKQETNLDLDKIFKDVFDSLEILDL